MFCRHNDSAVIDGLSLNRSIRREQQQLKTVYVYVASCKKNHPACVLHPMKTAADVNTKRDRKPPWSIPLPPRPLLLPHRNIRQSQEKKVASHKKNVTTCVTKRTLWRVGGKEGGREGERERGRPPRSTNRSRPVIKRMKRTRHIPGTFFNRRGGYSSPLGCAAGWRVSRDQKHIVRKQKTADAKQL